MNLKGKNVLFVIPNKNFRDEELFSTREVLESYGANTFVACSETGEAVGMLGKKAKINLSLDKVIVSNYDGVIFVGGSGSTIYYENKTALNLLKEAKLKGKVIGGICLASGTLANAGILKGIKATGWTDTEDMIDDNGGVYTGSDVEISGRIITAKGPKNAKQFGEELSKALAKDLSF